MINPDKEGLEFERDMKICIVNMMRYGDMIYLGTVDNEVHIYKMKIDGDGKNLEFMFKLVGMSGWVNHM